LRNVLCDANHLRALSIPLHTVSQNFVITLFQAVITNVFFSVESRNCGRMPFQCALGLCLSGLKHQSRRDGIMNIHEYQAKALLRDYGAPVSDGRAVLKAEEAKTAAGELDGPLWVVKAQIHAGGRGKGSFKEADAGEKAACAWPNRSKRPPRPRRCWAARW
jgi:hypothetical protein